MLKRRWSIRVFLNWLFIGCWCCRFGCLGVPNQNISKRIALLINIVRQYSSSTFHEEDKCSNNILSSKTAIIRDVLSYNVANYLGPHYKSYIWQNSPVTWKKSLIFPFQFLCVLCCFVPIQCLCFIQYQLLLTL